MKKYLLLLTGCLVLSSPVLASQKTCQGILLENITECGGHQMGAKISPLYPRLSDKDHNPSFYVTDQQHCLWPAAKIRLLNCHIAQTKTPPFYQLVPNPQSAKAFRQEYLKIHHLLAYEKDSDLSMADASDLTGKYLENAHSACGQKVESYLKDHQNAQKWTKEKWQSEPCPVTPINILTGQNKGMFSNL